MILAHHYSIDNSSFDENWHLGGASTFERGGALRVKSFDKYHKELKASGIYTDLTERNIRNVCGEIKYDVYLLKGQRILSARCNVICL